MSTAAAAFDPYAPALPAPGIRFLYRLNPLVKFAAPLPAILLLVFTRDPVTPAVFLALAYAVLLVGARATRTLLAILFVALPVAVAGVGLGFAVWTDAARVDQSVVVWQLGSWTMFGGAIESGFATSLRLGAIAALALIGGITTTGSDLVRALVQQLRVPYRVGYTALAAFRFVPRFGHELAVIRAAHRVRGTRGGRGPIAAVRRAAGYVVPLLAGAIRHAERVALAMEARAFGAHPDRTERYPVPFRARDVVFLASFWAASAALAAATFTAAG